MVRSHRKSSIYLALLAMVLSGALVLAAPKGTKTKGSYDTVVKGYYKGSGKFVVAANQVHVQADIVGENGESGKLKANNVPMDKDRFYGTGDFNGQVVTISGRVESPDGQIIKVARVCCIFAVEGGQRGIMIGSRKGP